MTILTWNSAHVNGPVTLSADKRTATGTSAFGEKDIIGNLGIKPNSNKYYWEVSFNTDNGGLAANVPFVGMTDLTQDISVSTPTPGDWGLLSNGQVANNNALGGIYGNLGPGGYGLAFAYDSFTQKWWASTIGGAWFNAGNPANGTGNLGVTNANVIYPLFQCGSGTNLFGASISGFNYVTGNVPAGFIPLGWEPTPPNTQQLGMINHRWKY